MIHFKMSHILFTAFHCGFRRRLCTCHMEFYGTSVMMFFFISQHIFIFIALKREMDRFELTAFKIQMSLLMYMERKIDSTRDRDGKVFVCSWNVCRSEIRWERA